MMHETRYDRLVNKLYGELALSPSEAGLILDRVAALATKRTQALAKIRERAHRDYCRADHTFNEHYQIAWAAARDEILGDTDARTH